MIRLNVSEQQLFDMIMAVYSQGSSEEVQPDSESARRREALLDKLHRAFDSKIIAPRAEHAGAPIRMMARNAAIADSDLPAHEA